MAQPAQSLDLPDLFNFNSILLIEENGANSNNVIHNRQSIMLNGAPQTQCPECKLPITDQYFLAVDERSWHPTCLKCSACGCNLNEAVSCFVKYNRLYCKLDYEKNFLKNCIRCKSLIQANDVTMKVGSEDYYHARCFSCSACHQTLQTGEQFIRGNFGQLLCQLDAMQLLPDSYVIPTIPGPVNNLSVGEVQLPPPPSELVESTRSAVMPYSKYKARRKKDDFSDDGDASNMGLVDGNGRAKRMRTSFKHQQLKIMRHYFNLNQNPDSKDLKNLAVKTGLTKRVLQVYFQNARSAYRRKIRSSGEDCSEMNFSDTGRLMNRCDVMQTSPLTLDSIFQSATNSRSQSPENHSLTSSIDNANMLSIHSFNSFSNGSSRNNSNSPNNNTSTSIKGECIQEL